MKQISTQQRGFFFQQSTIVIRLFRHQPHPPLPPQKRKMHMNFLLIQFLLRRLYYPGDNENDNNIKKFWGGGMNKVRYEQCKNVELGQNTKLICLQSQVFSIGVVYHSQTGLSLRLCLHTKADSSYHTG